MDQTEPEEKKVVLADEVNRISLLDVVITDYNKYKDRRVSRLLLSGEIDLEKVRGDVDEEVLKWQTNFNQKWAREDNRNRLTGVLLCINRKCIVHCLEAPTSTLFEYVRSLKEKSPSNILKNTRICSFTEEVPREYPVWGFRVLGQPEDIFDLPKNWLAFIFETLQAFLELGREVAGKTDPKAAVAYLNNGGISRGVMVKLPTLERIQGFAKCPDLCTPDEYLDIYDTPIEFTLEGELVWPVEPFLRY